MGYKGAPPDDKVILAFSEKIAADADVSRKSKDNKHVVAMSALTKSTSKKTDGIPGNISEDNDNFQINIDFLEFQKFIDTDDALKQLFQTTINSETKQLPPLMRRTSTLGKINEVLPQNDDGDDKVSKEEEVVDKFADSKKGGDEFMATKPWLGSIFAPSTLPPIDNSLPDASLSLGKMINHQET
jgi:hypothetical protein